VVPYKSIPESIEDGGDCWCKIQRLAEHISALTLRRFKAGGKS